MTTLTFNREESNQLKTGIQETAAHNMFINDYKHYLLEWCVGIGKSRAAIKIAEKQDEIQLGLPNLIFSSEKLHISNWKDEIKECGTKSKFHIHTYHSLVKVAKEPIYVNTLILDECHNVNSSRAEHLKNIHANRIVLLSAEVPKERKFILFQLYPGYKRWYISLGEAIEKRLIPIPNVKILNIYPDKTQVKHVYEIGQDKRFPVIQATYANYLNYVGQRYNIQIPVTEAQYLELLDKDIERWKQRYFAERAEWQKFKWLGLGSQRKRFIASLKTKYLKQFVEQLGDKRFLCFTGSTIQCDEMSTNPDEIVHSKSKEIPKEQLIKFNSGLINRLFVVNMFREGMNLVGLDLGIIAQADGSFKMVYQKIGRLVRGTEPYIYVLRLMQSQDEKFVSNFFDALPLEFITQENFNVDGNQS